MKNRSAVLLPVLCASLLFTGCSKRTEGAAGAPSGSAPAAATALAPIPPLTAETTAYRNKNHYFLQQGPWGSTSVSDLFTPMLDPGTAPVAGASRGAGFGYLDGSNPKRPLEGLFIWSSKRHAKGAGFEPTTSLVQYIVPPPGYTWEGSVDESPLPGFEPAVRKMNKRDLLDGRVGYVAALGRGETVYWIVCYSAAPVSSDAIAPLCVNALEDFRPPAGG